jgi:hypothetical protein
MSDLDKRVDEAKAALQLERLDYLKEQCQHLVETTQREINVTAEVAGAGTILERYDAFEVVMTPVSGTEFQMLGTYVECFAYVQGLKAMLQALATMAGGYTEDAQ